MREEAVKQAIAFAYRANGFAEKLHREGNTRRGDIVRETRERILSLETEQYPACVLVSILETAEVLKRISLLKKGTTNCCCVVMGVSCSYTNG